MEQAKPDWLKIKAPVGEGFGKVRAISRACGLRTVCDASHCPNISDCWSRGHATFLIMGPSCTRRCAFCAVGHGPTAPLDPDEPERVGKAIRDLKLAHAVITSVTRDDLDDYGAGHFASVVESVRRLSPGTRIELLIPDMMGSRRCVEDIVDSAPDVIGHNIETVCRLQSVARDPNISYDRSLNVLRMVKEIDSSMLTKSGLMLGLGESYQEVVEALQDLRNVGVDAVTIGQYLRPKGSELDVTEYVKPEEFDRLAAVAHSMGFCHVASAPLVRSSFNAHELFASKEEDNAHRGV